ncbi:Oxysterol-binding protein-domain-containing protein [Lipomyces japonicus]|uniref:Oxysterol-binding protein-domain-containing protein n=1 Tax=Lipomyces japonicus TaxID=56871 RepID=UPI0034CF595E
MPTAEDAIPVRKRTNSSLHGGKTSFSKGKLEESIRTYKLLEALRANDVAYISKLLGIDASTSVNSDAASDISVAISNSPNEVSGLLHLAVQVASASLIELIVSSGNPFIDINGQDVDGNTPLHLAASLGREDIVSLLMERLEINDTIVNAAGKQAVEVCRYPELTQAMQVSRAQFVEKAAIELKRDFESENLKGIDKILSNSRAAALLDINGQDPDAGTTVLHDAVRKKQVKVVQYILDHGGDPFRRDRKGKLPIDLTKDETIRKILKAASKSQSIVTDTPVNAAPIMKGYLKKWTNYTSGYKLRWFVLENGILSYYKQQDDADTACRGSINMRIATLKLDSSEKQRFEILGKGSVRYHLRANHSVEASRWVWALTQAIQFAKDEDKAHKQVSNRLLGDAQSFVSSTASFGDDASSGRFVGVPGVSSHAHNSSAGSVPAGSTASADDEVEDFDDDDESQDNQREEPYKDEYSRLAHSLQMEIKVLQDISSSISDERSTLSQDHPRVESVLSCYDTSLKSLRNLVEELLRQTLERETYFKQKIESEAELRRIWEDNMQKLAEETDAIEEHLHDAVEEKKLAKKALREALNNEGGDRSAPASPIAELEKLPSIRATLSDKQLTAVLTEEEDDEFFDAIGNDSVEEGALALAPGSEAASEKASAGDKEKLSSEQLTKKEQILNDGSFHGYKDAPRTRLKLAEDDRPKISLWGILKSMIGKDMTKMTLPVSFNECTSLLQRVAEDMEYTDLLDTGATKSDSALRMVYVAAFAASEYSSTINRIAKPFNPLLGETYEYCRPDRGYRFVIEQVSHHPPVGAALAESAKWDYWGESAVKSKFNGRSFDINPLGTWFLKLRPDDGDEELYTWKKVTSSVVGIITGSPVVDNYGDMEIKNHTTGDRCILKFKSRGWLGSGAYEVYGNVLDKKGVARWSVGGRWNDKIYGRKYQTDTAESLVTLSKENADLNAPVGNSKKHVSNATISTTPNVQVPFLVWQNHARPSAPFNLTPFAITLNALPEDLKPWLPPTDTRLRPDQRAMEDGRYDVAATEKNRVEEKQRARRRERELQGTVHAPRWFRKAKHKLTGDEYWEFKGDYWKVREELGQKTVQLEKRQEWQGVDNIF